MYVCPLCPPERTSHLNLSLTDFLKHVKLLHSHQPGFNITCGINGCIRSFKNFRTFQDHVSAFHRGPGIEDGDNRVVDNGEDGDGEVDRDCEDSVFQSSPEPQSVTAQLQRSSALFLLGLKEKHKLTQVALQGLIEGTTALVQCRQDILRSQLLSILSSEDLPASVTTRITECLSDDGIFGRPFLGLETQHQQVNYYKTNLRLIVSFNNKFMCRAMYILKYMYLILFRNLYVYY